MGFTGRAKVYIDDVEVVMPTISEFIQNTDEPVYIEEEVMCDLCDREYVEWTPSDPAYEPPMHICRKDDCETIYLGRTDQ